MNHNRELIGYGATGIAGAIFAMAISEMFPPGGGPDVPFWGVVLACNLLMAVVGFLTGRYGKRANVLIVGAFAIAGIASGVLAWVSYDFIVHDIDHNLFPFNIALESFFAVPGILVGFVIGRGRGDKAWESN